jgi:hypothetical protein
VIRLCIRHHGCQSAFLGKRPHQEFPCFPIDFHGFGSANQNSNQGAERQLQRWYDREVFGRYVIEGRGPCQLRFSTTPIIIGR